jgi:hypothetical protein
MALLFKKLICPDKLKFTLTEYHLAGAQSNIILSDLGRAQPVWSPPESKSTPSPPGLKQNRPEPSTVRHEARAQYSTPRGPSPVQYATRPEPSTVRHEALTRFGALCQLFAKCAKLNHVSPAEK